MLVFEVFEFQREQAELNRQHELKMLEIIMKFSNNSGSTLQPQSQCYSTPVYNHAAPHPPAALSTAGFTQYGQAGRSQGKDDILDMDNQPAWY